MSDMIRVELGNGIIVEGPPEKVASIILARTGGLEKSIYTERAGEMYTSKSKGITRVMDMDSNWIRNALLKMTIDNLNDLRNATTLEDFVEGFGRVTKSQPFAVRGFLRELAHRSRTISGKAFTRERGHD